MKKHSPTVNSEEEPDDGESDEEAVQVKVKLLFIKISKSQVT
jgi:hypothetical protein